MYSYSINSFGYVQYVSVDCFGTCINAFFMAKRKRNESLKYNIYLVWKSNCIDNRHFSLLNVNAAGACGYDFVCDGRRLVRAYLTRRRGAI